MMRKVSLKMGMPQDMLLYLFLTIPRIHPTVLNEHISPLALIDTITNKYITVIRSWISLGDLLLAPGELAVCHNPLP